MGAMIISGYIPNVFPAKHLSVNSFRLLGQTLKMAAPKGKIYCFDNGEKFENCWAYPYLDEPGIQPADENPPADRYATPMDALRSNVMLLERFRFMARAHELFPKEDPFIWLEYSIFKQAGINTDVIRQFVKDVEEHPVDAISFPGCWPKQPVPNPRAACWRFCGSAWVCPRKYVWPLYHAVKGVVDLQVIMTNRLSWDMNTVAYVELMDILPIRWYRGNHDETQLTNYLEGL